MSSRKSDPFFVRLQTRNSRKIHLDPYFVTKFQMIAPIYPRYSLSSYSFDELGQAVLHFGCTASFIKPPGRERIMIDDDGKLRMSVTTSLPLRSSVAGDPGTKADCDEADVGPGAGSRQERLRVIVEDIVANVFHVDPALLRLPTRGRANIALARQVAMYIAHVGYGLNLTDVGVVFERDRTTVAHACSVVEMRREDREFDAAILLIEYITRAVNGPYTRPPGHAAKSDRQPSTIERQSTAALRGETRSRAAPGP